jgi:hypothetical protein
MLEVKMRRSFVLFGCVLLVGCGHEGSARWATAPGEDVKIGRHTYRVAWLQAEGGYNMRSHYNELIGTLDDISDKNNAMAAVREVGQKLCGRPIQIEAETKADRMYSFRT